MAITYQALAYVGLLFYFISIEVSAHTAITTH